MAGNHFVTQDTIGGACMRELHDDHNVQYTTIPHSIPPADNYNPGHEQYAYTMPVDQTNYSHSVNRFEQQMQTSNKQLIRPPEQNQHITCNQSNFYQNFPHNDFSASNNVATVQSPHPMFYGDHSANSHHIPNHNPHHFDYSYNVSVPQNHGYNIPQPQNMDYYHSSYGYQSSNPPNNFYSGVDRQTFPSVNSTELTEQSSILSSNNNFTNEYLPAPHTSIQHHANFPTTIPFTPTNNEKLQSWPNVASNPSICTRIEPYNDNSNFINPEIPKDYNQNPELSLPSSMPQNFNTISPTITTLDARVMISVDQIHENRTALPDPPTKMPILEPVIISDCSPLDPKPCTIPADPDSICQSVVTTNGNDATNNTHLSTIQHQQSNEPTVDITRVPVPTDPIDDPPTSLPDCPAPEPPVSNATPTAQPYVFSPTTTEELPGNENSTHISCQDIHQPSITSTPSSSLNNIETPSVNPAPSTSNDDNVTNCPTSIQSSPVNGSPQPSDQTTPLVESPPRLKDSPQPHLLTTVQSGGKVGGANRNVTDCLTSIQSLPVNGSPQPSDQTTPLVESPPRRKDSPQPHLLTTIQSSGKVGANRSKRRASSITRTGDPVKTRRLVPSNNLVPKPVIKSELAATGDTRNHDNDTSLSSDPSPITPMAVTDAAIDSDDTTSAVTTSMSPNSSSTVIAPCPGKKIAIAANGPRNKIRPGKRRPVPQRIRKKKRPVFYAADDDDEGSDCGPDAAVKFSDNPATLAGKQASSLARRSGRLTGDRKRYNVDVDLQLSDDDNQTSDNDANASFGHNGLSLLTNLATASLTVESILGRRTVKRLVRRPKVACSPPLSPTITVEDAENAPSPTSENDIEQPEEFESVSKETADQESVVEGESIQPINDKPEGEEQQKSSAVDNIDSPPSSPTIREEKEDITDDLLKEAEEICEEDEEVEEDVEEFYLKFKGLSYLHCDWRAMDEINDPRFLPKLKRFELKQAHVVPSEDDDLFNPDYIEVERVLASRVYRNDDGQLVNTSGSRSRRPKIEVNKRRPAFKKICRRRQRGRSSSNNVDLASSMEPGSDRDVSTPLSTSTSTTTTTMAAEDEESDAIDSSITDDCTTYYLVKWRSLAYEDATWELAQDVDPAKVKDFIRRANPLINVPSVPRDDQFKIIRPDPNSWIPISFDSIYKNQNQLRDYQVEGVNWLTYCWYHHRNCILADEMGLGKTVQSVAFLLELAKRDFHGPSLIIVPLSTVGNWQRELANWSDFDVVVYHGGTESRKLIQEHEIFYFNAKTGSPRHDVYKFNVVVTTFEVLMTDIEFFGKLHWAVGIIDEAHRLKNKKCKLGEGLRYLNLDHRVLLTGTPLQNNVEELFGLLNFLEPERFSCVATFLAEYGDLKTEGQVENLKLLLKPMMLRRLKEDVEKSLAPKEETIIEVELTNTQKQYYRAITERNLAFLCKGSTYSNGPKLMNVMMELRKCCNHPFLIKGAEEAVLADLRLQHKTELDDQVIFDTMVNASGKLVLIHKLLPKLRADGHKVLIFSQMIRVLDILEDYLLHEGYSFERLDGRIHGNLRQAAIDRFCSDPDKFVFLLCTKAGGLGINLTAADVVIINDSDWNPQNDLQAQARCHRIGQSKMVKVYRLVTRNTYEREMFDRASLKLGLDKAILKSMAGGSATGGGISAQDAKQTQLSRKEVEDLLRKGAYAALMDDDHAGEKFCEEDIDQILQSRCQIIKLDRDEQNSTFSKATFSMSDNRIDIQLDDPEFWQKWAKKAGVDESAFKGEDDVIIETPRERRQTNRYSVLANADSALTSANQQTTNSPITARHHDTGTADSSPSDLEEEDELTGGSGELTTKRKKGRPPNSSRLQSLSTMPIRDPNRPDDLDLDPLERPDMFRVERCLLTWPWGRWESGLVNVPFKRTDLSPFQLGRYASAVLAMALHYLPNNADIRTKATALTLTKPGAWRLSLEEIAQRVNASLSCCVHGSSRAPVLTEVVKSDHCHQSAFHDHQSVDKQVPPSCGDDDDVPDQLPPPSSPALDHRLAKIEDTATDSGGPGSECMDVADSAATTPAATDDSEFKMTKPTTDLNLVEVPDTSGDPERLFNCDAFRKHVIRGSSRLVNRVAFLHFLQCHIVGLPEAIQLADGLKGFDDFPIMDQNLPAIDAVDSDLPAPWWQSCCDKSLLLGIVKHGWEKYLAIRLDPLLCFREHALTRSNELQRTGDALKGVDDFKLDQQPDGIDDDVGVDDVGDVLKEEKSIEKLDLDRNDSQKSSDLPVTDSSELSKTESGEEKQSTMEVDNCSSQPPSPQTNNVEKSQYHRSADSPSHESAGDDLEDGGQGQITPCVGDDNVDQDEQVLSSLLFPAVADLNSRARKLVGYFQRVKSHLDSMEAAAAKRRQTAAQLAATGGGFDTGLPMSQFSSSRFTEPRAIKWTRREEADFYRTVSSFGVEFTPLKGGNNEAEEVKSPCPPNSSPSDQSPTGERRLYVWNNFRKIGNLYRKSDQLMVEYFQAFYQMCQRVCKRPLTEFAGPSTSIATSTTAGSSELGDEVPIFPISEERANRCLSRIDLLSRIRNHVLPHPDTESRLLRLCRRPSADLPRWWQPGRHDFELLQAAAKHGLARTELNIQMDPEFSFHKFASIHHQSQLQQQSSEPAPPILDDESTARPCPTNQDVAPKLEPPPPAQSLGFVPSIWPKDRTIQHRLELVCKAVESNEWPLPRRGPILIPPSACFTSTHPVDNTESTRSPDLTGLQTDSPHSSVADDAFRSRPDVGLFDFTSPPTMDGQDRPIDLASSLVGSPTSSRPCYDHATPPVRSRGGGIGSRGRGSRSANRGGRFPSDSPSSMMPPPSRLATGSGRGRKRRGSFDHQSSSGRNSPTAVSRRRGGEGSEIWNVRVPVINLVDGSLIYGDQAPERRQLETWLESNPSYMPYSVEAEDRAIYSRVAASRGQEADNMEQLAYKHYFNSILSSVQKQQQQVSPSQVAQQQQMLLLQQQQQQQNLQQQQLLAAFGQYARHPTYAAFIASLLGGGGGSSSAAATNWFQSLAAQSSQQPSSDRSLSSSPSQSSSCSPTNVTTRFQSRTSVANDGNQTRFTPTSPPPPPQPSTSSSRSTVVPSNNHQPIASSNDTANSSTMLSAAIKQLTSAMYSAASVNSPSSSNNAIPSSHQSSSMASLLTAAYSQLMGQAPSSNNTTPAAPVVNSNNEQQQHQLQASNLASSLYASYLLNMNTQLAQQQRQQPSFDQQASNSSSSAASTVNLLLSMFGGGGTGQNQPQQQLLTSDSNHPETSSSRQRESSAECDDGDASNAADPSILDLSK